jgi:hypothetical protein
MTESELYLELNELVSRFLENSGDPSILAETLREIADDVFEEDEEEVFEPDGDEGFEEEEEQPVQPNLAAVE